MDLTIRIADWAITLDLDKCDAATRARLAEHYAAFQVPLDSSAPVIRVGVEPGEMYVPFDSSHTWQIRTSRQKGRMEFASHYETGWLDFRLGQGELEMRPDGTPENFLRVVYAWFCLDHDALLLHASGVIRKGRGYVFFGPSGSGKTTITRLSQEHTILSDDIVVIRKQDDRWRVYGVPFRGEFPEAPRTNAAAEIQGIFALAKDTTHWTAAMPTPEAIARLSACVPFVIKRRDDARRVTDTCAAMNAARPVRTLHFRRDAQFWEVIDELG